jgi:hypothetical protein
VSFPAISLSSMLSSLQQRVGSGGLVSAPAGAWGGKGGEHAPVRQAGHLDVWSP